MIKTILFNTGTEDVTLTVQNCFAYTYNAVKTVLKLNILEADHSFAEVSKLKENKGTIVYREDGEIKTEYDGYTLGAVPFKCNYSNGSFDIEMDREDDTEIRLQQLESAVDELSGVVSDLAEALDELASALNE